MNSQQYIPRNIRVLGTDNGGDIFIWSTDNRVLHRVRINDLTHAKIIQIAGNNSVMEIEECLPPKAIVSVYIRNAIADVSRSVIFNAEDMLGQGIWRCSGKRELLVVTGKNAYVVDPDTHHIKELDGPVYENRIISLGRRSWVDMRELVDAANGLSPNDLLCAWNELVEYLRKWSFKHDDDCEIIAGLVIATLIQATLLFRPLVWITGASHSGKSRLFMLLDALLPNARRFEGQTSEAAIRQSIQTDALPILMDEQEPWYGRGAVNRLLRSSTGGGSVVKGSVTGKAIEYRMNHIVWCSSIVPADLQNEADRNRFIIFELSEAADGIHLPTMECLSKLRTRLLTGAMLYANKIMDCFNDLMGRQEFRKHGRLAEVYGVPIAVASAMRSMEMDRANEWLHRVLDVRGPELANEIETDEEALKRSILMLEVYAGECVATFLDRPQRELSSLAAVGIRKMGDNVFIAHSVLQTKLQDTRWKHADLGRSLRRLPGAKATRQRFPNEKGIPMSGVLLPLDSLIPPLPVWIPAPQPSSIPQLPSPPPPVDKPRFEMGKVKYDALSQSSQNQVIDPNVIPVDDPELQQLMKDIEKPADVLMHDIEKSK